MEADPIRRIYKHVEALRAMAATLPEEQCGLALIVSLLGEDLQKAAEELDNRQTHARSESGGTNDVRHEFGGLPPLPDAQGAGSPCACESIA